MLPGRDDLTKELDEIYHSKAAIQRKLIQEDRRLDVLARVLGYQVLPFHWILIEAKKRLRNSWRLFLAPRGSGKSTILTVVDSVLQPLLNANVRILIGSRVKDQAKDLLTEIQGCFRNERFCELFGDLRGDRWGADAATVATRTKEWKEPTWLAAGADGPVTSKHFDLIKADDLVDERNARTEGERARIKTFVYKTLIPTLIQVREDGSSGEVEVVGTRYNPDDVYGHMIDNDPNFAGSVCIVPALINAETAEPDPNGVSICPELLPTPNLRSLRTSMGMAHFDSQYMQSTDRMKGEIFKDEYFCYYETDPRKLIKAKELKIWAACDLAIAEKESDDEYADAVIGVDDTDGILDLKIYVLDLYHGRVPYSTQIERASYVFKKWDPIRFGIESNAFQKSRLNSVYRELGSEIGDRCVPVVTLTDKVTRAWKLAARYENGRIFHPKEERWKNDLESQLLSFPLVKHDDCFDALELAVTLGCVTRARKRRKQKVGVIGAANRRAVSFAH